MLVIALFIMGEKATYLSYGRALSKMLHLYMHHLKTMFWNG